MDIEPLLEVDNRLNEKTLDKATEYVLYLHSCIEDFKSKKTIHYESNPVVYPLYDPFLNCTGSLLLYNKLSGKMVLQTIYKIGE